jgi:hypothetical protein
MYVQTLTEHRNCADIVHCTDIARCAAYTTLKIKQNQYIQSHDYVGRY